MSLELKNLLETGKEYTYEEAFDIYDKVARTACNEENKVIKKKNIKIQEKIDKKNLEHKEEASLLNKRAMKSKLLIITTISLIISQIVHRLDKSYSLEYILILFVMIFIFLLLIIKGKKYNPKKEPNNILKYENYTYQPSGTVQCSSCGTKTKIDSKRASSVCPNCKSEIFVISSMEDNVIVKTKATSKQETIRESS